MRFRISHPEATKELVRFLRVNGYLAVECGNGVVEAVPIRAASSDADRVRTLRDVETWAAERGGMDVEPLADETAAERRFPGPA